MPANGFPLVIPPGSAVTLRGDITATVIAVKLTCMGADYCCVWWDGNTRKCEWLDAVEVEPANDGQRNHRIGFTTN